MTETVRQVAPGNACSCNPEDGLNEQAVVRAGAARITGLAGQVRLHPLPLMVLQQQPNRRHPTLPEKELESDFRPSRNPKCQRALGNADYFIHLGNLLVQIPDLVAAEAAFAEALALAPGRADARQRLAEIWAAQSAALANQAA